MWTHLASPSVSSYTVLFQRAGHMSGEGSPSVSLRLDVVSSMLVGMLKSPDRRHRKAVFVMI